MGYRNRYGSTKLKDKRIDNLSIGWDYNRTPKSKFPVFLFTPDMECTNIHYHIALNRTQAKKLNKWLTDFLKDVNANGRKRSHSKSNRRK